MSDMCLFLTEHLENLFLIPSNDMPRWFTCPQNVIDVGHDHDHHDASDGEAVENIEDVVFCEPHVQATLVGSSATARGLHPCRSSGRRTASYHLGGSACLAIDLVVDAFVCYSA